MYGLILALSSAAVLSGVHASPAPISHSEVKQIKNPAFKRNGLRAYAKAYLKFNKPMPPLLAKAVKAANDGSVTASPTDPYDSEYVCPVNIDGQVLNLDFDTGSSDLWVFSTSLSSSAGSGHTLFNPARSPNWKAKSGYKWSIQYGDGSGASGTVGTDTVTIGGTTVTGQAVEIANKVSSSFTEDTANSGLLGLAFSSINTVTPNPQKTFFDNAMSSLSSPLFTADLKYHAAGTYVFGTIDSSKYTGSIHYVDIDNSQGFWEFSGDGYAVGNSAFKSLSIDTIADTGTTLIYVPTSVVKAYYAQVSGAKTSSTDGGYVFPCSSTLPNLTLGVNGYKSVVPGKFINYAPASASGMCFGGVQSNTGIGISIYGDVWLKSQFVVFDGGNLRLGLAKKNL